MFPNQAGIPQVAAGNYRIGHEHPPVVELAPIEVEPLVGRYSQLAGHPVQLVAVAYHTEQIALPQLRMAVHQHELFTALEPGEQNTPLVSGDQVTDWPTGRLGPRHPYCSRVEPTGRGEVWEIVGFLCVVHLP